jgi:hypothetical protein
MSSARVQTTSNAKRGRNIHPVGIYDRDFLTNVTFGKPKLTVYRGSSEIIEPNIDK